MTDSMSKMGYKFFDYFSIGHFILGIVMYLISEWIMRFMGFPLEVSKFFSFILIFSFSLFWEIFENCTRIGMRVRSIKRVDTLNNSLGDIFFAFIGSLVGFFLPTFF